MTDALSIFERLVRRVRHVAREDRLAQTDEHPFDTRNIHPTVAKVARKLFDDGHYAQATFEAYKLIDKTVQKLSKLGETGHKLMMQALDEAKPKIGLNALTSTTDRDEQSGYRFMLAGAMSGIRNPRGHENNLPDTIDLCLDHLTFASHLLKKLETRLYPKP